MHKVVRDHVLVHPQAAVAIVLHRVVAHPQAAVLPVLPLAIGHVRQDAVCHAAARVVSVAINLAVLIARGVHMILAVPVMLAALILVAIIVILVARIPAKALAV